jgi:hypothetical protein
MPLLEVNVVVLALVSMVDEDCAGITIVVMVNSKAAGLPGQELVSMTSLPP